MSKTLAVEGALRLGLRFSASRALSSGGVGSWDVGLGVWSWTLFTLLARNKVLSGTVLGGLAKSGVTGP